jgi:virginiamycin A acetyltransferase
VIGNDLWIGQSVTIMPGVKVGDVHIIAANATVVKNVEPYAIVGGILRKRLKKRFDDEKICIAFATSMVELGQKKIFDNLEKLVFADDLVTLKKLLEG